MSNAINTKRHWKSYEKLKLAKLAKTHTDAEIGELIGRTTGAVMTQRYRSRLSKVDPIARTKHFQPDLFDTKPIVTDKHPVYKMGVRWVTEINQELYELVPLKRT